MTWGCASERNAALTAFQEQCCKLQQSNPVSQTNNSGCTVSASRKMTSFPPIAQSVSRRFPSGRQGVCPTENITISGALHPCFLSPVSFERSEIRCLSRSNLSYGWLVGPRLKGKGSRGATSGKAAGQSMSGLSVRPQGGAELFISVGYKEMGSEAALGEASQSRRHCYHQRRTT